MTKHRISPRARRIARELGVDTLGLREWQDGRIASANPWQRPDIRAAAVRSTSVGSELRRTGIPRNPVTPIRRTIAERMVQSAQTTACVTLSTTVDATNLVNLRQQFKAVAFAGEAAAIGFTDIVVKLAALALEKHPIPDRPLERRQDLGLVRISISGSPSIPMRAFWSR